MNNEEIAEAIYDITVRHLFEFLSDLFAQTPHPVDVMRQEVIADILKVLNPTI